MNEESTGSLQTGFSRFSALLSANNDYYLQILTCQPSVSRGFPGGSFASYFEGVSAMAPRRSWACTLGG